MKNACLLLLCLLVSSWNFAQKQKVRGKQFELTGTIIHEVGLSPHCGIFAFATVIEFQIQSFSDPNYTNDSIAVIFTCPELYGADFFQKDAQYQITVADEDQADFGWMLVNQEALNKYTLPKKLWVLEAEKVKANEH